MSESTLEDDSLFYNLPPSHPSSPLPVENQSVDFPFETYHRISKEPSVEFDKIAFNDPVVKKVILDEISKCPVAQCLKSGMEISKIYLKIVIATFKRTGVLLPVITIKKVYHSAKNILRHRLRTAILRKRLSPKQTEAYMRQWEYYPYMRFFRKYTAKWEEELIKGIYRNDTVPDSLDREELPKKKLMSIEAENRQGAAFPEGIPVKIENDDDFVFKLNESLQVRFPTAMKMENTIDRDPPFLGEHRLTDERQSLHHHINYNYPVNPQALNQYNPMLTEMPYMPSHFPSYPDQIHFHQQQQMLVQDAHFHKDPHHQRNPQCLTTFKRELDQINFEIIRVSREQPHQLRTLFKALFDVVRAFDSNNEYPDEKELYKFLYDKK